MKSFYQKQYRKTINRIKKLMPESVEQFLLISGQREYNFQPVTESLHKSLFAGNFYEDSYFVIQKQSKTPKMVATEDVCNHILQWSEYKAKLDFIIKNEDLEKIFKYIFNSNIQYGSNINIIGVILDEIEDLNDFQILNQYLKTKNIHLVDLKKNMESNTNYETQNNYTLLDKSSQLNGIYMKKIIQFIETAIEEKQNITHAQLFQKIDRYRQEENDQIIIQSRLKLEGKKYKILRAVIQSGGKYDHNAPLCDHEKLTSDIIFITMLIEFAKSQTFCQRTLLFKPDEQTKLLYNAIVNVHAYAVTLIQEGLILGIIYRKTKQLWLEIVGRQYEQLFPDNIGYTLGMDKFEIDENCQIVIGYDSSYVISIIVQNLNYYGSSELTATIGIADTVCVNRLFCGVITNTEKQLDQISYNQLDGISGKETTKEMFIKKSNNDILSEQLKVTLMKFEEVELTQRQQKQGLLKLRKQFDNEVRLAGFQSNKKPEFYQIMDQIDTMEGQPMPKIDFPNAISIDTDRLCIYVPVDGIHYVFNALTIQGVQVMLNDGPYCKLQIKFWTNQFSITTRKYPILEKDTVFIKQLSFQTKQVEQCIFCKEQIEFIRSEARKKNIEEQIQKKFQQQPIDKIRILNKQEKIILPDIFLKPVQAKQKSVLGSIECHENGFVYTNIRQVIINIPFNLVKNAFYISSENDVIVAIHLEFQYVAKIAKESYAQMQFYRDIKGAIEQEATRKKQNCIIDIEFDQKIYKERRKNHLEFQEFLNQSKPFYEKFGIEFQRARKEEGFEGNLGKDRILFQPTKSCLINIIDSPFFILTIEDVEIMCCERVMQGTLSFDVVIVYKDLERSPTRIEAVDYEELPKVEAWMNKADILYFVVTGNLIWKNILHSIQKDFALFVQEGGWSKIMKDVMDHAPIQFKDDQSSLYEPSTSKQPTSYSEFTDEEEFKLNPLLYQEKSIIDSVSAIGDSENFMSQDVVLPVIKKVKIQEIAEVVVD